jgi:hypothetical protein
MIHRACNGTLIGRLTFLSAVTVFAFCSLVQADAPKKQTYDAPNRVTVAVEMIGPVTQKTDLQIICVLKHDPAGDKYIEAMEDFNEKLGGLLSSLRTRGEFTGEAGETLLFDPPAGSITPKRVLMIGVGDEKDLTIEQFRLAGRIAARESTRLGVAHVSWAPALRDQGSTRVDVGDGDAAFVEQFLLAYDTEVRLQRQALTPKATIEDITIEAGPTYFAGAAEKVKDAVATASERIKQRENAPYKKGTAATGK